MENKVINVWTDGGARPSTNVSGWAYVGYIGDELDNPITNKGAEDGRTNQQMEIKAVIEALNSIPLEMIEKYQVNIHSDSAYICNCFKDSWWKRWELNNWKNSKGEDVANKELWEQIISYYKEFNINFVKTKGHSNDAMNNLADKLVNEVMDDYEKGLCL